MSAPSTPSTSTALDFETRALLFNHLATMENAGVPALQSFQHLKINDTVSQRVAICRRLLNKGKDIAQAGNQAGLFDYFEFELLCAASAAGSLGICYKRLAKLYLEKAQQEKRLKARMRLPLLMLVFALVLLRLPALIAQQISFIQYLLGIILPIVLLYVLISSIKKRIQKPMRKPTIQSQESTNLDIGLLRIPLFGKMIARDNARQFYESLSLLLEAGVAMFEAMPMAINTVWNREVRKHFEPVLTQVLNGQRLSEAMASSTHMASLSDSESQAIELIRTGEVSGCLSEMLWRHVDAETEAQSHFREEVANWAPKIVYAMVAAYIVFQIFRSNAFMPHLPADAA